MPRIQRLKLLYALASLLFVGYCAERLLATHYAEHMPLSIGTFYCLLLFVSVPAFGYLVLFKLVPLTGRLLRR